MFTLDMGVLKKCIRFVERIGLAMHCIPKDNTLLSDSIVIIQDKMMDSLSILLRFTKVNFKQHFTICYPSVGIQVMAKAHVAFGKVS
jgi:hypothetical protein